MIKIIDEMLIEILHTNIPIIPYFHNIGMLMNLQLIFELIIILVIFS